MNNKTELKNKNKTKPKRIFTAFMGCLMLLALCVGLLGAFSGTVSANAEANTNPLDFAKYYRNPYTYMESDTYTDVNFYADYYDIEVSFENGDYIVEVFDPIVYGIYTGNFMFIDNETGEFNDAEMSMNDEGFDDFFKISLTDITANEEWIRLAEYDGTIKFFERGHTYSVYFVDRSVWSLIPREQNYRYSPILTFDYFVEVDLPETPVKTGYDFKGWYYDSEFTTIYDGEPIYTGIDLYAKFEPINYLVRFLTFGGEVETSITTYTIEDEQFALPIPTRYGYTFLGWYPNSDFSGEPITSIAAGSHGNKTFCAKWEINKYTVNFYVGETIYKQLVVEHGQVLSVLYLVNMASGEVVKGYNDSAMQNDFDFNTEVLEDTTVYAASDFEVFVALTYVANGRIVAKDLVEYNSLLADLRIVSIKDYDFAGWYYDKDENRPVLSSDKITGELTIYAGFTVSENISFGRRMGIFFSSPLGIIICSGLGALVILGVIGYVIHRKRS